MHELLLCGAIADIATQRAGARRIEAISVRIGQWRHVAPTTLLSCWDLVVAHTSLEGARLRVEVVTGDEFAVTELVLAEPDCSSGER